MGIFDFLKRKKQDTETVSEKEIKIHDLLKEVESIEKEKFSDFYKTFSNYSKQIELISKELEKQATNIEKAKIKTDVDERLLVRIKSAKENLLKKIGYINKNYLKRGFDFSNFDKISESIEQMDTISQDINKSGSKYTGAVVLVHKREVNHISGVLKKMLFLFKDIKDFFEDNKHVSNFKKLGAKSSKLIDLMEFRKKIESEIEVKYQEKEVKEKEISELKEKSNDIEKSENYKQVKEIEYEIKKLTDELNNEKAMLRTKFSGFNKAFNKFAHDYPLNKDEEKLVEIYLGEPFDAMDNDPKFEILHILKKLKDSVDNDKLGIDDKLKNRASSVLSEIMEQKVLEKSNEKKKELLKNIEDKKEELEKSGVFKLNALNVKLKDAEKQSHDIKTTLEVQDELLKKNSIGVDKLKKEVTELFSKFNINAKIFNN